MTVEVKNSQLMNKYKYELHIILIKLLRDPEIEQRMITSLYDNINTKYDVDMFRYNDDSKTFDLRLNGYYPDIDQYIKKCYSEFIINLLSDPYTINIINQLNTNTIFVNSFDFTFIARECITVLNMSTDKESMVLRINLYN